MKHKVLILGTLGEFTELVKKAKEKGYETVVCDGYADGIARTYADKAYTIPVTDVDAIALMCREEGVDGIITSFSDLLLECMVKIADKAGLPCYLKPEQLSWYRDKSACRDVLDKLGLPAPGFRKISVELLKQGSEEEIQQSIANLQYPLISKPLDKYGSRGIFIIHHSDEVRKKALQTAEYTDCQEILVEEYNDGYEFNMMTWVMDGKVNVISIADREKTEMEEGMLPLSTRNVYPSRFLTEVEKSATDILQNYIRYTGQTEGALSMQFFWKPGRGIQVCEIAGRFFGYEHELTDMVYGFQTEELLLDYLYEKDRIKEMFHRHDIHHPVKYGAVLYFQGRQLQIADQTAACELAKEKCVVKPWIFYKEGERVIEYGPNPYLALYYIETENRRQLEKKTEKFFSEMSIRDPEGREVAYRNKIPEYEKEKKQMIDFNRPAFTGREFDYIRDAVQRGMLCGDGEYTKRCSQWMMDKFHVNHVMLTTSCTHALEMAAHLCDIKPGDEVIMPSYTFVSTADAFVLKGAKIVFVDIRPDTMNIDEKLIEAAVTEKTKVIVPVHYAGVACEMDTIMEIAKKYNLKVVEDAAQGVDAYYKGKALGTIGDFGCYSFHETKNYTMGEGGAILFNRDEYVEKAEILREKGTDRSKFFRGQVDKYRWIDYGSSYLPSELNAAYLYAQLEARDQIFAKRMEIYNYYHKNLAHLAQEGKIEQPYVPEECSHNAHMYYIKVRDIQVRTRLIAYLREKGICSVFHYVPLHSAPAGQKFGRFSGEDVYTTKESERLLRLPMFYNLDMEDVKYITDTIASFDGF